MRSLNPSAASSHTVFCRRALYLSIIYWGFMRPHRRRPRVWAPNPPAFNSCYFWSGFFFSFFSWRAFLQCGFSHLPGSDMLFAVTENTTASEFRVCAEPIQCWTNRNWTQASGEEKTFSFSSSFSFFVLKSETLLYSVILKNVSTVKYMSLGHSGK